jgi:hypothetical protein
MADSFEADCDNCLGLCCTALRFSRADGFGHDKSAGEPCFYLTAEHRCRIHDQREDLGYEGCIDFDCFGAGQRATASISVEDRTNPAAVAGLYVRLRILIEVQELRQALTDAADLELANADHSERMALLDQLAGLADNPQADLASPLVDPLLHRGRALIGGWREQ